MEQLPKNHTIKIFVLVLTTIILFFLIHFQFVVNAISSVTVMFDVTGDNLQSGDIVITVEGNYLKSTEEYSGNLLGVIVDDPSLALRDTTLENGTYVTTSGEAFVNVSAVNGAINAGDYITTSNIPGVGMKSTKSGQVLGIALESFEPADTNQIGQIWTFIDIGPVISGDSIEQNALELLRSGISAPFLTPMTSLRFLLSFIVIIVSFFLGFVSFSKITGNSIQALGRNPLASNVIKSSVVMNFFFTIIVIMVGVGVAYLILSV